MYPATSMIEKYPAYCLH